MDFLFADINVYFLQTEFRKQMMMKEKKLRRKIAVLSFFPFLSFYIKFFNSYFSTGALHTKRIQSSSPRSLVFVPISLKETLLGPYVPKK